MGFPFFAQATLTNATLAMTCNQSTFTISSTSGRDQALDFTKGMLVLFMIVYHWLNYFYGPHGPIYTYLRFLPPSFIFTTGFLISHVYFTRYPNTDWRGPKRLFLRGLRLLALFTGLNLCITWLFPSNGRVSFTFWSLDAITTTYITGNTFLPGAPKAAAFSILVPISYLLILSAGLLLVGRRYPHVFPIICAMCFLCVFLLNWHQTETANLELLAVGFFGVVCGQVSADTLSYITKHQYAIVILYLSYVSVITMFRALYALQVLGVCLTLLLLYCFGTAKSQLSKLRQYTVLLGKYSLWGYMSQVAILQLLHRSSQHVDLGDTLYVVSLFSATILTILSVAIVHASRAKVPLFDKVYRSVFS